MEKLPTGRIRYTSKDLQIITGNCMDTCRREMKKMREHFNLRPDQDLTVFMVSEYRKTPVEELIRRMIP